MKIPAYKLLHLDTRKLPAIVFEPIFAKSTRDINRENIAEEAFENFGKPGRDPNNFISILQIFATNNKWNQQLDIAKLRSSWNSVVGDGIANHCEIAQIRDGILYIRTQSAVWSTQLSYLLPSLKEKISKELPNIFISEIRVIGPTTTKLGSWKR